MAKPMEITTLAHFEAFLKTRIPSREALFMGDIGLKRAKYFMKLLGNPQNKIKVIHIAGTSGKGSTAYITSHILQSQGFKVGLSISPHVFDIRERMQINNQLPSEKLILKYFKQILPIILQMEKSKYGSPTFFEINVGLAYYIFAQEKIDYAVIETGLGGLLDGTNTVNSKNKICILTKMGLDHTEILGNSIGKITQQKAGIIQTNNVVISNKSSASALKVIRKKCEEKKSKLFLIDEKNHQLISSTSKETIFDFSFKNIKLEKIKLGLIGMHQAENCSLSLSCLMLLAERDKFKVNERLLRSMLRSINIPGRMEIFNIKGKTVIIDGAHNPQKMEAFIKNLTLIYPKQKFQFIIAFKKGKDFETMLQKIIPSAESIMLSRFSTTGTDNHWSSIDNQQISTFLQKQKFNKFKIISEKKEAISNSIMRSKTPIVITGSLYFISTVYGHTKNPS